MSDHQTESGKKKKTGHRSDANCNTKRHCRRRDNHCREQYYPSTYMLQISGYHRALPQLATDSDYYEYVKKKLAPPQIGKIAASRASAFSLSILEKEIIPEVLTEHRVGHGLVTVERDVGILQIALNQVV